MNKEVVLVISDTHFPHHHQDTFVFLQAVKRKYRPTKIICSGDEVDMHAMSSFDHDPDGYSPGNELKAGIKELKKLYQMFPEVMVCSSNHTARVFRRAYSCGIPRAVLKSYHEFLKAPKGWQWKDKWIIDDVIYEHGESVSGKAGALNAALNNMQSTVIAHLHCFSCISYSANDKFLVFGMNVGCLIDKKSYAFAYGKKFRYKPVISCGIVDKGIPMIIPMQLSGNGRWIKQL